MGKILDMTGWIMSEHGVPDSKWTVIELDKSKPLQAGKHAFWICECSCDKHTRKSIDGCALRNGQSKSCGCQRKSQVKDEIGNKYGHLTVLDFCGIDSNNKAIWLVQCDCGSKPFKVLGCSLRSGNTKSCGCAHGERQITIETPGTRYGKLVIIKQDVDKGWGYWKCQCDCGNIITAKGAELRAGLVKSCGCLISKGEERILSWLQNHNIPYKKEYCFKDLVTSKGGYPRFDFAIFDNNILQCVIEYQGKQHYEKVPFGDLQRNITDQLKREYCITHNIPLYEIKYNENVETILEGIFYGP